jgi:hypothetical protein
MELYIQMGHGMQSMCKDLLADWKTATIIVSPMNIQQDKLTNFASDIRKQKGAILFDSQWYYPRKYHKNLNSYSYWPKKNATNIESGDCKELIASLAKLNLEIGSSAFILPSSTVSKIEKRWDKMQQAFISEAKKHSPNMDLFHTVALTGDVLMDDIQVETIVQCIEQWSVTGIYIVCEHPDHFYFIDKPLWISNLLALVSGIKKQRKKVIVGYASQQMLCLALAKCDAIAAGNFLNVRWFKPEHFETIESDEISRRAIWYYCPQALSEYKLTFLDIAKRMKTLKVMAPPPDMMNSYCKMLFGDSLPSSTGYKETEAHRHYLYCLHQQCRMATRKTYQETLDSQLLSLETAEQILSGLRDKNIKGQDRDFGSLIDVNRAAISAHEMDFKFSLSQEWDSL